MGLFGPSAVPLQCCPRRQTHKQSFMCSAVIQQVGLPDGTFWALADLVRGWGFLDSARLGGGCALVASCSARPSVTAIPALANKNSHPVLPPPRPRALGGCRPPRPRQNVWGLGVGSPPTRGVWGREPPRSKAGAWGAAAPQGGKVFEDRLVFRKHRWLATKRPQNWSPALILGAFCAIFRARPV